MDVGESVGPYTVQALLGQGGMGEVYLCKDERLGRRVALKVVGSGRAADENARRRLLREARTASALNHPNVCTIYDVGTENDRVYIALEYVAGQTLSKAIGGGALPHQLLVSYGRQIAEAVAHAHAAAIVHCDLKSANIMVTPEGRIKVLDFGLATPIAGGAQDGELASMTTITDAGDIAGTPSYMAPELLRGARADARSDVWALGVVLFEAACGALPFRGATLFELCSAILKEEPAALPASVPAEVGAIVDRCLAKQAEQRYADAGEVAEALRGLERGESGGAISGRAAGSNIAATAAGADAAPADVARANATGADAARAEADAGPAIRSIAVLPLENLSGDPDQEFFSDGMTDALITELAKIGALKVISRTSTMRFKKTHEPLPAIAAALNVDAIVEGSVFRVGDEVRVTSQLIHAASDTHLWADSYERDLRNVLALQKEVARDIVGAIEVVLTPRERVELAKAEPVDPAVYEAILRGRFHIYKFSPEGLQQGESWLRRALEMDPDSAPAHAYLSMVYGAIGTWGDTRPLDVWPEATRLANRAVELDPTLPESRYAAATMRCFVARDLDGAEEEFRALVADNPGFVDAHYNLGLLRAARGDLAEAEWHLARAIELDPLSPAMLADSALPLIWDGRFSDAEERARTALDVAPDYWRAHWTLAAVLASQGRFSEAIEAARRSVAESGGNVRSEATLATVLALAGETDEAREALEALLDSGERRFLFPSAIASIHAAFGDLDQAFEWLEKGDAERDLFMLFIAVDPLFRGALGGDSRYENLLVRTNLSPTGG